MMNGVCFQYSFSHHEFLEKKHVDLAVDRPETMVDVGDDLTLFGTIK